MVRRRRVAAPQSLCHPALQTFDILEAVFKVFDSTSAEDRAACANAALTCRSFTDPASRIVWGDLPHLKPLWNILLKHRPLLRFISHKKEFDRYSVPKQGVATFRASRMVRLGMLPACR